MGRDLFAKYFRGSKGRTADKFISERKKSEFALRRAIKSNNGRLILKYSIPGVDTPQFLQCDESNCENAFLTSAWKNLSQEDIIKTLKMYIDKVSNANDIIAPSLRLIDKQMSNNKNVGGYYSHKFNELFVDLEKVSGCTGLSIKDLLDHELTHAVDYYKLHNFVLPRLCRKYLNVAFDENNFEVMRDMMELPIEGVLYNYQKNKSEIISHELRNNIMLAKSAIVSTLPTGVCDLSNVHDKSDFELYLINEMYYFNPLERRARNNAKLNGLRFATSNDTIVPLFDIDRDTAYNILTREDAIDARIGVDKCILGDMNNLYDAFIRHSFYIKNGVTYANTDNNIDYKSYAYAQRARADYHKMLGNAYSNHVNAKAYVQNVQTDIILDNDGKKV